MNSHFCTIICHVLVIVVCFIFGIWRTHIEKTKISDSIEDLSINKLSDVIKNARKLDDLGQYEEALSWYEKALEISPNDVVALYNKGGILASIGKHVEAITCYDKVIDINPTEVGAIYNKALALVNVGKYEDAIFFFDKVLQINPTHIYTMQSKRIVLDKLGKHSGIVGISHKQFI